MTESTRKCFLLVEDDDAHAAIMIRSIQNSDGGHRIERVKDGSEALRYLHRDGAFADRPQPDVVLLDLNLPGLHGHEVLEQVKQDPDLRVIPIVIFTTSDAEIDRERAYRHHANSYLVKPMDFDRFRQIVRDMCVYWGQWNCTIAQGPRLGEQA